MTLTMPSNNHTTHLLSSSSTAATSSSSSMHSDYINALAFDVYGRRMATCSGDRCVKVWELTDTGAWTLVASWQAHRGAVTAIAWAHPEFGSLLATAGTDHDVKVWEERSTASTSSTTADAVSSSSRWFAKAALTEARRGVTSCEFAPRHWGLKLAVGSAEGCVRIYEAVDIMNLSQWPLAATLNLPGGACTSISWSNGRFEPPTIVVAGNSVLVYRYSESARDWHAILSLSSEKEVLDVAWAPNVGRRFHLIATAEHDQMRIYTIDRTTMSLRSSQTISNTNAWRCQWNVTGTVLASSGDGGKVCLWKANSDGLFQLVSQVQGNVSKLNLHRDRDGAGQENNQ